MYNLLPTVAVKAVVANGQTPIKKIQNISNLILTTFHKI